MKGRIGELRHLGDLPFPCGREGVAAGLLPMASDHGRGRHGVGFGRTHQPDAVLHVAVIGHHRGGVDLHRRPARPFVDKELSARTGEMIERGVQRQGPVARPLGDREQARFRAGPRMGVDRLAVGDDEALRAQRFQPRVVGSGRDGAFDPCVQQLLEGGEEDALKLDGQRQHPVEEGRDGRKLVLYSVGIDQLEPGRLLEPMERAALDLAAHEKHVELPQRVTSIVRFQIVFGAEQALTAGLALSARDCAQRVEPPGDRG